MRDNEGPRHDVTHGTLKIGELTHSCPSHSCDKTTVLWKMYRISISGWREFMIRWRLRYSYLRLLPSSRLLCAYAYVRTVWGHRSMIQHQRHAGMMTCYQVTRYGYNYKYHCYCYQHFFNPLGHTNILLLIASSLPGTWEFETSKLRLSIFSNGQHFKVTKIEPHINWLCALRNFDSLISKKPNGQALSLLL